jgi:hypothetical protein
MPDFAARLTKVVPLTVALNINILPIVTQRDRKRWESYSHSHDQWVDESMAVQEEWDGYNGPIIHGGARNDIIHSDFGNIPDNYR